jgi:serine/threonine protein kinase/regulation of enolase protein 1 (concanavalin A-like superfamily)
MTADSCPDLAQLQELVNGDLAAEEEARLTAHLDSCVSCREKLETLAGEEFHLLAPDAELTEPSPEAEPALAAVMDQLQQTGSVRVGSALEAGGDAAPTLSFLAPPAQPENLGRLGHYEVLSVVGRGGMGIVLKARDEILDRIVAVKVMAPQLAANVTARQRFIREARAAAAVRDEHVISIHAVGDEDGLPFMVMEYINGISLQDRLNRKGPVELREVLRIGMQMAKGLAAAHAQGLVHRDIKPANILLENGVERVKIGDFGLARAADDASLTQSGVIAGTPEYMAPEQARGEAVDHRTDLFSLGSVLYALCAGQPPFRAAGALAVLKRVCEETPRPLAEINPDIPEWLCQLIAKLHAKNPAQRFSSAEEVADLLCRGLSGPSPIISCPDTQDARRPASSPVRTLRKGRRRWLLAALSVLLLGVALILSLNAKRLTTLAADLLGRKSDGLAGGAKVEAPPAPPDAQLADWGRRFDPDGDCTFKVQDGALTIDVPPTPHDLSIETGQTNAPRVLREVDGDFRLQVKVCGDMQPMVAGSVPGRTAYQAGGILLSSDERNYVRLERAAFNQDGKITPCLVFQSRFKGRRGLTHMAGIPAKDTYLRLERRGNRLRAFVSADGRLWHPLPNIDIDLSPKVQVGIAVINTTQQLLQVRFKGLQMDH